MPRYNDLTNSSVNYGADARSRIVNVDAIARDPSAALGYGVTDFQWKTTTPVRNVHAFQVTSVELSGLTFAGSYVLLQVNDESSIESKGTTTGTEIRAVAKIQKPVSGTTVALTANTGLLSSPVVFRNPQDITLLRVRLVNPDGTTVEDAGSGTVSFTLEMTEVLNSYLYESQRKHIGYDPANVKK